MPACSAGHNTDVLEVAELLLGDLHVVEKDLAGVLRDAAEQGVSDRAGLLEDFLLHEMLVATFFRHDGIPGDVVGGAADRAAVVVHDVDALWREDGDVAVGEEKDFARVLKKRGDVARDKIFAFA